MVTPKEVSITSFGDLHFAKHLADDDLDVLIVDLNTLDSVNFLNLVDEVFLKLLSTTSLEEVFWSYWAVGDLITSLEDITFCNCDSFTHWYEVVSGLTSLDIGYDDFLLTTNVRAEGNFTVDLSDGTSVLWTTSFEELSNTWKTTSNIFGLFSFTWSTCKLATTADDLAFGHRDVSVNRNRVGSENFRCGFVYDDNGRVKVFFMLSNDHSLLTSFLVSLVTNSNAGDHVAEFNFTSLLSKNRHVVWIPSYEGSTLLHFFTVLDRDHGTNDECVFFNFESALILDRNRTLLV